MNELGWHPRLGQVTYLQCWPGEALGLCHCCLCVHFQRKEMENKQVNCVTPRIVWKGNGLYVMPQAPYSLFLLTV